MNAAGAVLILGATGFIGQEVARRLLLRGRRLMALARGPDDEAARDRVGRVVGAAGGDRLEVVRGDLTLPGCGLRDATVRRLREQVETVINCAGDASFHPEAMAPFHAGHIDGPRELAERLHGARLARWGHLSTAYVCGRRSGIVGEFEVDVGQSFHNPYERIKLESEVSIRETGRRLGLGVTVFRPSIVVGQGPDTVGAGPSLLFFGLIRIVAALAQQPGGGSVSLRLPLAPGARFNIVPVEYVADAVVTLVGHPGAADQTVHLVVEDGRRIRRWWTRSRSGAGSPASSWQTPATERSMPRRRSRPGSSACWRATVTTSHRMSGSTTGTRAASSTGWAWPGPSCPPRR